jgi:hypothetical protein
MASRTRAASASLENRDRLATVTGNGANRSLNVA